MEPKTPKILLVDDHPLFLKGVRSVVAQAYPSGTLIEQASDGATALQKAHSLRPDIVVMDIHLPGGDGIVLTRQLLAQCPDAKVIILSGDPTLAYVTDALKAGASGYLMKANAADELLQAVETVLAGRLYLCAEANAIALQDYKRALVHQHQAEKPALSVREQSVLELTVQGCRVKEIGDRLGVGVKTAETYRRRLLKKLGCSGTADLVRRALREGLVPP